MDSYYRAAKLSSPVIESEGGSATCHIPILLNTRLILYWRTDPHTVSGMGYLEISTCHNTALKRVDNSTARSEFCCNVNAVKTALVMVTMLHPVSFALVSAGRLV